MTAKCSQCHCIKIVQNHHIVAKADGGDNETTFLCRGCHLRLHRRNVEHPEYRGRLSPMDFGMARLF